MFFRPALFGGYTKHYNILKINIMRTITAKFASKCAATGQPIKKGQTIIYDPNTKKAYIPGKEPINNNYNDYVVDPGEIDADNFCQRNNI